MNIRPILMTPNLTNMTKITTLQALIESSMPAELKKMQWDPQRICMGQNLKNVGLGAKNVLLSIGWSHFLTKMVFLQSSIIKNFFAQEN